MDTTQSTAGTCAASGRVCAHTSNCKYLNSMQSHLTAAGAHLRCHVVARCHGQSYRTSLQGLHLQRLSHATAGSSALGSPLPATA